MLTCIVCKDQTDKYKCPNCLAPYCSLQCCKEHKNAACEKVTIPLIDESLENQEPTLFEPFRTEDTVTADKLELLRTCEPLHKLLYNPHLRNLLTEIDVAKNAWTAIKAAMQEPLFVEFADECLKVIEPMERTE